MGVKMFVRRNAVIMSLALTILDGGLLGGCVTVEPEEGKAKKVFYPEPPELPRLQYLRSYLGSMDFEEEQSAFDTFVVGGGRKGFRLDKPYGVIATEGSIYVADSNFSIMQFDLLNRKFKMMEGAKGLGKLVQPVNICIDANGNKYVADPVRQQVLMYDAKDFYVKSFRYTSGWRPVGVTVQENNLFVTDRHNRQVHVFDVEKGRLVNSIGREGAPEERMSLPLNIAVGPDGVLYVVDGGRFQVLKYDLDGHYLGSIGESGQSPGHFARPRGIAVARDGLVYVVDAAFDYVQVFHPTGQLLTFFGGPGNGPGNLHLPAGITIDYDNVEFFKEYIDPNFEVEYLVIVTSQFGDRLVNVYGYGKQKGVDYPDLDELLELRRKQLQEMEKQNLPR